MILKICRVRDPEDIDEITKLSPDMMGFDFCRTRPSYMGEVDESILHNIPYTIRKVGLFINESPIEIASIAGRFMLNSVQLDGDTSPAECEMLAAEGLEVIKTFYISDAESFYKTQKYEGVCNRFIFKLSTTLDYSILDNYTGATPFMLSLKMDNIVIPVINHKKFCGFDTASSCETSPTKKNINSLAELVNKLLIFT